LAVEVFESLTAAQRLTRPWRDDYNGASYCHTSLCVGKSESF